jgi:hypothetical protein
MEDWKLEVAMRWPECRVECRYRHFDKEFTGCPNCNGLGYIPMPDADMTVALLAVLDAAGIAIAIHPNNVYEGYKADGKYHIVHAVGVDYVEATLLEALAYAASALPVEVKAEQEAR